MKSGTIFNRNIQRGVLVPLLLVLLLSACEKEDQPLPQPDPPGDEEPVPDLEPDPAPEDTMFYRLIRVENFQGDVSGDEDPTAPKPTLYYSLEQNKPRTPSYEHTDLWDVAFSSLYASFLSSNNGTDPTNIGYGTKARGGMLILEKPFDEVIDIPDDSEFKTGQGLFGTDDAGNYGTGTGWYLYDFGGTLVRDGGYDNMHIAYALGEPLELKDGTVVPARTIVVRTASGHYAKLKMISLYKDAFTPDEWFRNAPHVYITFEYVMVPKGSTKFEIK